MVSNVCAKKYVVRAQRFAKMQVQLSEIVKNETIGNKE